MARSFCLALSITLLANMSPVLASIGQYTINNACSFPVYLWQSSGLTADTTPMVTIPANGGQHVAPYDAPNMSVKMARTTDPWSAQTKLSQLEVTTSDGQQVWYDLSNINGNAFADVHVLLHPMAQWQDNCQPVDCPAGDVCKAAYTTPTDNWATHVCASGTDLVFDLCVQ